MEHSEELIRKVRGAMIYPAIVVIAIIIVGILMLIYVVPTLTKTFPEQSLSYIIQISTSGCGSQGEIP
jgi:type IV pilus assembly protein PilC